MSIFNNPWVIGIGGGILSGIIVTVISRYLFSRRDNKEYLQKVFTANQEVLYAIRPSISDGVVPSSEIVDSLISATARKYGVEPSDLYTQKQIANELVKEVMDSSFLSASSKTQYCDQLAQLKNKPLEALQVITNVEEQLTLEQYRHKMTAMMSVMLGTVAALMTASVAFKEFFFNRTGNLSEVSSLLFPTTMSLLAAFIASYLSLMIRKIKKKHLEQTEDKRKKGSN